MNINEASRQQLEETAQIDGTRADYLIQYRREHGAFTSWDEVEAVPSFDEGMVRRMKDAGFTIEAGDKDDRSAKPGEHDLNAASAEELEATHMIDGERARRFVEYRSEHGGVSNWEEVKSISGFDEGLVERLQQAGFELRGSSR